MSDETLDKLVARVNRLRARATTADQRAELARLERRVDRVSRASYRLAVYGTLSPGKVNHGVIGGLQGAWRAGTVRGARFTVASGPACGFPAVRLDPAGGKVAVWVLESAALPSRWGRLDTFEGPPYRRLLTRVAIADDVDVVANLYVVDGA